MKRYSLTWQNACATVVSALWLSALLNSAAFCQGAQELCQKAFQLSLQNKSQEACDLLDRAIGINSNLPDPYFLRGRIRLFALKQYKGAREDLDRAIELDPNYYDAFKARAQLNLEEKNYTQGIIDISRAIALRSTDKQDYSLRGLLNFHAKRYAEAIKDFDTSLAANPNDRNVIVLKGRAKVKQNRFAEAISDYNKALSIERTVAALGFRSYAYYRIENYNAALADANEVLMMDPNDWAAYQMIGHVNSAQGQFKKALANFDKSLQLHPNEANTLEGRGALYEEMGEDQKAIDDFTAALKGKSEDPIDLRIRRAISYNHLEKYDAALADFNIVLKTEPKNIKAILGRAASYRGMKKYDLALAETETAIRLDNNSSAALNSKALIFKAKEKYAEAIALFSAALAKDKKGSMALFGRGDCYFEQDRYIEALKDYSEGLSIDPKNLGALHYRAFCYLMLGDYDSSIKEHTKLHNMHPKFATYLVDRGYARRLNKQHKEALSDFDEAKALEPGKGRWERADVLNLLGKYDEAIAESEKILTGEKSDQSAEGKGLRARATVYKARAMTRKGEPEKARELLRTIDVKDILARDAIFAVEVYREAPHFLLSDIRNKNYQISEDTKASDVDERDKEFQTHLSTKHFLLSSNESKLRLGYYATFAEAFLNVVENKMQVKDQPSAAKTHLFLMTEHQQLVELARKWNVLKTRNEKDTAVVGIYENGPDVILVDGGNSFYPLAHCIAEKCLLTNITPEPWAAEGIPSLFSKCYGYYTDLAPKQDEAEAKIPKLEMHFGYQLGWQLGDLKHPLTNISIEEILAMKEGNVDQRKARLLAVFLYLNNKLPDYIRVCQSRDKGSHQSYLEAAFNQPLQFLQAKWIEYLKSVEANEEQIGRLPPVDICETAEEFASFAKSAGIPFPDAPSAPVAQGEPDEPTQVHEAHNANDQNTVLEILKEKKPAKIKGVELNGN